MKLDNEVGIVTIGECNFPNYCTRLECKLEREFIPAEKDPAIYWDCKFVFKLLVLRKLGISVPDPIVRTVETGQNSTSL